MGPMDSVLQDAVDAAGVGFGEADRWFELVVEAYDGSSDWSGFQAKLRDGAGSQFGEETIDRFLAHTGDRGGLDEVHRMKEAWEAGPDESGEPAVSTAEAAETGEAAQDTAGDEAIWAGLVRDFGQWEGWDGTEDRWTQLRDWLYSEANQVSEHAYGVAYDRLSPLDEVDDDARVARLRDFGFTVVVTARPAEGEDTDDQRWAALARDFGDWQGWDGTEDRWAQLRDWLYTEANEIGQAHYETAYFTLSPLDGMTNEERVAALTDLGITVTVVEPEQPGATVETPEAQEAAEAPESAEEAEEVAAEQLVENVFEPAMEQFEERLPELAAQLGISVDELRAELADLPDDFFGNLFAEEVAS